MNKTRSNDTAKFFGRLGSIACMIYFHLLHKLHSEVLDQEISPRGRLAVGRICILCLGWHFEASAVEDMYSHENLSINHSPVSGPSFLESCTSGNPMPAYYRPMLSQAGGFPPPKICILPHPDSQELLKSQQFQYIPFYP